MKVTAVLALALPALIFAYPGMAGTREALEEALRTEIKREPAPEPQLSSLTNSVGTLIGCLGDTVAGLLNSVGKP